MQSHARACFCVYCHITLTNPDPTPHISCAKKPKTYLWNEMEPDSPLGTVWLCGGKPPATR